MNTCVICGCQFAPSTWRPKALTCSQKCNAKRQDARRREERKHPPDGPARACVTCHTEFVPKKYGGKRQKHCSPRCRNRAAQQSFVAKNPHGARDRMRRWKLKGNWLLAVERDAYTCQVCGVPKKRVTVHHKDGSGEDGNPNHDLANLVTLCFGCHNKLHRITFRVIGGEVYVIGKVFDWLGVGESVKVLR